MTALAALLLLMWILKKIPVKGERRKAKGEAESKSEVIVNRDQVQGSGFKVQSPKRQEAGRLEGLESEEQASIQNSKFKTQNFFFQSQFVVAVILLSATLSLSHGVEFREKIPIKKSFEYFPINVGQWSGVHQSMNQKIFDALDLDDYVTIDFHDKLGRTVNFYVAYYESQRKGESIHSPATCLPGTGWIFNQAGAVTIPLSTDDDGFMKVNRAFMQKGAYKQLSYYWFPQRGRILTNAYQLKIFAFWDALTRQRTDGALVRLITPVYEFEEPEDAEARLQGFAREIVPVLGEYIPD